MNPSTAKEYAWGGCGSALHQRGRIFLAAHVELIGLVCHFAVTKCSLTLCISYLALLPFSTTLSAYFTSVAPNRYDVTCSSSVVSVMGCDGALFLCRYLVEGFSVGALSYTFK